MYTSIYITSIYYTILYYSLISNINIFYIHNCHTPKMMTASPPSPPSTRLVIYKLILKNFKSYAGIQELGPFHQSFSAVVGPNGSGKSNVIDALLFVFGYRAGKLRQPKVSDLIHCSESFPNCESCSVQVIFQEIQDSHSINSISIERIAYKSNKSDYMINGSPSTFTHVTNFLREKGIDLDHHRFLILQGEVESIALMKPKATTEHEQGLLEYLEDMIGTYQYKPLIEGSLKSFESSSQEANQKTAHLRILEQDLASKKALKEEAESFLHQENILTQKRSEYHQLDIHLNTQTISKLSNEKHIIHTNQLSIQDSVQKHTLLLDQATLKCNQVSQSKTLIEKQINEEKHNLQQLERKSVQSQETKKHLKQKLSKCIKAYQQDKSLLTEKSQTLTSLQQEYNQIKTKQLDELKTNLVPLEQELEKQRTELKGKTKPFQQKIDQLQIKLEPFLTSLSRLESQTNVLQSEHDMIRDKVCPNTTIKNQLLQECNQLRSEYQSKQSSISKLKSDIESCDKEHQDLTSSKKNLDVFKSKITDSISSIKSNISDTKSAIGDASNNGNKLVDALISDSSIQGIYGRLADVGSVPDKYSLSLQSAAGNALDHIVVDTVSTGQKCIEYLRQHKLGRSTFIILEKVNQFTPTTIKVSNALRLYDLIQPAQEIFKSAFYFVLRDTLVTDTLEQANKVAFQGSTRHRVVTLDGHLIDKSGAMTGGGSAKRSKQLSNNTVSMTKLRKDLESLEKDLSKEQMKLTESSNLLEECNMRITALSKTRRELEIQERKSKDEFDYINTRLDQATRQLEQEQSKKMTKEQEKKLSDLQSKLNQLSNDKNNLEQERNKIQSLISIEEQHILEIGGVEFRAQLTRVDCLKEQITTMEQRCEKLSLEIASLSKTCSKLQEDIDRNKKEIEHLESQSNQVDEGSKQLAILSQQKIQELQEQLKENTLEELSSKKQMEHLQKDLNGFSLENSSIVQQIQDLDHRINSLQQDISVSKQSLDGLSLHSINGQESILKQLTLSECNELVNDMKHLKKEIQGIQEHLNTSKVSLSSIEEYKTIEKEYMKWNEETSHAITKRDLARQTWSELRQKRLDEFMQGFHCISNKLKQVYQLITLGGNAELELVDSMDPFSEGIIFSVMPPKKTWKNIANLSGGEKTLSSLALVFALHHYKPTPIYVMDEIDAALDFRNVSIVANYIKERTANDAQFIVISLRNDMFEMADSLVGIYKTQNCTKSVVYHPIMG